MGDMDEALDRTDLTILRLLQEDGRISNAEIARRVGMAPSAIYNRIQKLEDRGVIRGYTALIDPRALGFGLVAFVRLRSAEGSRPEDFIDPLSALPQVQELHRVVGEDCFFLKVRVEDTDALATLLDDEIAALPAVASTQTTIALSTAKDTLAVPLEALEVEAEGAEERSEEATSDEESTPAVRAG
jgi:Lrp/AsnC family leucine-responsive transcriptional regulator